MKSSSADIVGATFPPPPITWFGDLSLENMMPSGQLVPFGTEKRKRISFNCYSYWASVPSAGVEGVAAQAFSLTAHFSFGEAAKLKQQKKNICATPEGNKTQCERIITVLAEMLFPSLVIVVDCESSQSVRLFRRIV